MAKWTPLHNYLQGQPRKGRTIDLSSEKIRDIINAPLTPAAWKEGVYWANVNPHKGCDAAAPAGCQPAG